MMSTRTLALVCAVLTACLTNASNPVPEAERVFFFQSETDSLYVPGTDTLLTVYNDQQGVAIRDPNDPTKVINFKPDHVFNCDMNGCKLVWHGHTFAGYSVAASNGSGIFRFTRHDLVEPVDPTSCPTDIDCAFIMRGDPSLATNGQRVLYGNLAYTDYFDIRDVLTNDYFGEFGPNAMALSRDESGTGTFPRPIVVFKIPRPVFLDQGWVSAFGNAGVVAVHDARTQAVYLSTSDSTGTDSWSAPEFLPLPTAGPNSRVRTVVRMRSEIVGYIAYLEVSGTGMQPLDEFYNVVVVRITRNALSADWTAKQIFSDTGLTVASHAPGAGGHDWIDPIPLSFAIGDGGRELHLVYRDAGDVDHFSCRDEPLPTCDFSGNANVGWQKENFLPVQRLTGTRYQPWVAADPTFGQRLATVFWYQKTSSTSTTVANVGVLTGADAPMPHTPRQIFAAFEPCVAGYKNGVGRFGEYESAAWTPYTSDLFGGPFLWMVQYAVSSTCVSSFTPESITNDQFVFSTFFF